MEMFDDGHWNDNNCLERRGFICRYRQCKDPSHLVVVLARGAWHLSLWQLLSLSDHSTDGSGNPVYPTDDPGSGDCESD